MRTLESEIDIPPALFPLSIGPHPPSRRIHVLLRSFLFALFNADENTPWLSIQLARVLSSWIPNISAVLVLGTLVFGSAAARRSMLMLLLSMATAWAMVKLIRWGFPTQRPFQLDMGTLWVHHGGRSSFPSQHASGAFALAMAIRLA